MTTTTDSALSTAAVPFPSAAWFERLAGLVDEQQDRFVQLGYVDCTMGVSIVDGGPDDTSWNVLVTWEETRVTSVREATDDEVAAADFILETDRETWQEMVENITSGGGRPDLDHTLNRLSMAGTPIRAWSNDPLGKDMLFRYNQSIQAFLNNAAAFETAFVAGA